MSAEESPKPKNSSVILDVNDIDSKKPATAEQAFPYPLPMLDVVKRREEVHSSRRAMTKSRNRKLSQSSGPPDNPTPAVVSPPRQSHRLRIRLRHQEKLDDTKAASDDCASDPRAPDATDPTQRAGPAISESTDNMKTRNKGTSDLHTLDRADPTLRLTPTVPEKSVRQGSKSNDELPGPRTHTLADSNPTGRPTFPQKARKLTAVISTDTMPKTKDVSLGLDNRSTDAPERTRTIPSPASAPIRRSSRKPRPKRKLLTKPHQTDHQLDQSDGFYSDIPDATAKRPKRPSARKAIAEKVKGIGAVTRVSCEDEPTNQTNGTMQPLRNEAAPTAKVAKAETNSDIDINLRVQISLADMEPELTNLRGVAVNAQTEERRVGVLVDLLCAVDEASSDIQRVRKVLLDAMKENKIDPPFQRSILAVFRLCLGLPS